MQIICQIDSSYKKMLVDDIKLFKQIINVDCCEEKSCKTWTSHTCGANFGKWILMLKKTPHLGKGMSEEIQMVVEGEN